MVAMHFSFFVWCLATAYISPVRPFNMNVPQTIKTKQCFSYSTNYEFGRVFKTTEAGSILQKLETHTRRQLNRRRLDLRGSATLQIRARSDQISSQGLSSNPLVPSYAVPPVIICGPSGVGKVAPQQMTLCNTLNFTGSL